MWRGRCWKDMSSKSQISNLKYQIPNLKYQNYGKILIVRLDRIGDVLLSTPVIRALRDAYPKSYIAMMVSPCAEDIVKGNPYLNDVIIYDKDRSEKGLVGNLRFIAQLRRQRFDLAAILHPTTRSHLVAFLAGIPQRIGYDKKAGILLTYRIPHTKQYGLRHEIDYNLAVLGYMGIKPKDRTLYMPISGESERKVGKIFADNGISDSDIVIVVNPGASCPSKRWNADRFAEASDRLSEKYGAKIAVISSAADKSFGSRVASLVKRKCLNLAGRTTVSDIASVLRRSRLFISNDSGPVHIACAVGAPVVAIFGRSDRGLSPRRWGPSGGRDIVLHKDVGCEVCLAHNCRIGFKCLEAVSVEEVVAAAERLLKQ